MNNEQTTVAELLKSARVERGLSIKVIASEICVRSSYLTAIENADYSALPGKTFAIGFVKAYAGALGQDTAAIVAAFKQEYCPEIGNLETAPVMATAKPDRKIPGWLAPIVGLVGASACWMLLGGSISTGFMSTNVVSNDVAIEKAQLAAVQANIVTPVTASAAEGKPEVEAVTLAVADDVFIDQKSNALADPTSLELLPEQSASGQASTSFFAPAVYAGGVRNSSIAGQHTLRAVEDSWVRIAHLDGTEVWSGILREGQTYRPEAGGVLLLSTSNAGGVLLQTSGGSAESLGARGAIVSEVKLEDATLLSEQEIGELSELGSE